MTIKVKKLSNDKYEIEETIATSKQRTHIEKSVLEKAIELLEAEIAKKQQLLIYKKSILEKINKIE